MQYNGLSYVEFDEHYTIGCRFTCHSNAVTWWLFCMNGLSVHAIQQEGSTREVVRTVWNFRSPSERNPAAVRPTPSPSRPWGRPPRALLRLPERNRLARTPSLRAAETQIRPSLASRLHKAWVQSAKAKVRSRNQVGGWGGLPFGGAGTFNTGP